MKPLKSLASVLVLSAAIAASFYQLSCSSIKQAASKSVESEKIEQRSRQEYPLEKGFPTTKGIDAYVKNNSETVIRDFENFFNVKIENMAFETDNLNEYENVACDDSVPYIAERNNELKISLFPMEINVHAGIYFCNSDYAVISNQPIYVGYSRATTKKNLLANLIDCNKFVRGAMIHELGHNYVDQVLDELRSTNVPVFKEYKSNSEEMGSKFIEEGIAEYGACKLGEVISSKKYRPQSIDEIDNPLKEYWIYSNYATTFIGPFLDQQGLNRGMKILFTNRPPSEQEILHPDLFFQRLNISSDAFSK